MPPAARRSDSRTLGIRIVAGAVAVTAAAGLIATSIDSGGAEAASDDSSMTIAWADDTSPARELQPERDPDSPHYADFSDIEVTVSQTADLGDQAIRITVSGMDATLDGLDHLGTPLSTAMNFFQAMQCWGDPDEHAYDFRETCQWGGRFAQNNGLGNNTIYQDNIYRVPFTSVAPGAADTTDVGFRLYGANGGTWITGREEYIDGTTETTYPLLTYMNPATTNEVQAARISGSGTSSFDFELQSADQAPQLGCGREGHLTCYLVLIPRGTHDGGTDVSCSTIRRQNLKPYEYGDADAVQGGSPLNPYCDYWDNRIVVPLDFRPTGLTCPVGAAERGVIGSQMLVGAMASWQPHLCTAVGTTFTFSANPDSIARAQLVDGGAGLAFSSAPITEHELDDEVLADVLEATDISYAPVAIGAASVAFLAENYNGRIDELRLSPRLMAKLLTQSYVFTVPRSSAAPQKNLAHLPAANRAIEYINQDPDFQALNPNWRDFTNLNPAVVLPGPAGADAIRQVWRWILADQEARDWLSGEPDRENGMTVNPYYLPRGDPAATVPVFDENGYWQCRSASGVVARDAGCLAGETVVVRAVGLSNPDGTPFEISQSTLDRFLKVDESQVPLRLTQVNQTRYDTLQAFPYVESFLAGARDAFRADTHARIVWDPVKFNPSEVQGDWVSAGAQIPAQRFVIAVTDLAAAERYALDVAQLRLADSAEFGTADLDGLTRSLTALDSTENAAVRQVDPAAVERGYPLTTLVYAAVNLTTSTAESRADFADLIVEVSTRGQQPGTGTGDLPPGYLPLTEEMTAQASAAAAAIRAYVAPTPTPTPTPSNTRAFDDYEEYTPGSGTDSGAGTGSDPEISEVGAAEAGRTPAAAVSPIGQFGLAVALGIGVGGAVGAPLLLRGRRTP